MTRSKEPALTHGVYRLRDHGLAVLPANLQARDLEVVNNLATREGCLRELEGQARLMVLICECANLYLRGIIDSGQNPWTSGDDGQPEPILARLATFSGAAVRATIALAQLRGEAIEMSEIRLRFPGTGNKDE